MGFVKKDWESFEVSGSKPYVLKDKLKILRDRLRWWNKEVFGWVDLSVEEAVYNLKQIDNQNTTCNNKNSVVWS